MQKNKTPLLILFLPVILITSCSKNETYYHADAEQPGIAIFSNTGNNLLSCFIQARPWRTVSRTLYSVGGSSYEVEISRLPATGSQDTLKIKWMGYFSADDSNTGELSLSLLVPANSFYQYLNNLQGLRLRVDSSTGYFNTAISGINTGNLTGTGNIYFNIAKFDSTGPGVYSGKLAGLFEADFSDFKITNGRFDHDLEAAQIRF